MVRAPCCEKMGLKKGPWTRDEDQILINHVTLHGHGNWRALPKQAGLLRCGKSCRLRWINYLRPDIKRGNFSEQEEETIISLHQLLGNRWSAIAARLPGRTDNEIKNVWHTHLKKKMKKTQATGPVPDELQSSRVNSEDSAEQSTNTTPSNSQSEEDDNYKSNSTQQLSEDSNILLNADSFQDFLEVDDTFWSQVFSTENSDTTTTSEFLGDNTGTATSHFNGDIDFDFGFLDFGGNDGSNLNMNIDATDIFMSMLTNSSGEYTYQSSN